MTFIEIQAEKARIRALAEAAHAKYPQYDGYWDDWKLVEVISVKGLRARARHQWSPTPYMTIGAVTTVPTADAEGEEAAPVCYHIGTNSNCVLGFQNVRFLEE